MVSENEHSRNHELLRHRLFDIEQQTWISEIHNDKRKDPYQKKNKELSENLNLPTTTKITSQK